MDKFCVNTGFLKKNVGYPVWTCRDPIIIFAAAEEHKCYKPGVSFLNNATVSRTFRVFLLHLISSKASVKVHQTTNATNSSIGNPKPRRDATENTTVTDRRHPATPNCLNRAEAIRR